MPFTNLHKYSIINNNITIIRLLDNIKNTLKEKKFSLLFKFCYFANSKFAKFKSSTSKDFYKSFTDSLYDSNSKM